MRYMKNQKFWNKFGYEPESVDSLRLVCDNYNDKRWQCHVYLVSSDTAMERRGVGSGAKLVDFDMKVKKRYEPVDTKEYTDELSPLRVRRITKSVQKAFTDNPEEIREGSAIEGGLEWDQGKKEYGYYFDTYY